MKRTVLSLIFAFAVVASYAQCTPGSFTIPGIYPDTTTNLPQGAVSQYYFGTITAVVPADTTILGNSATIDSIGITEIQGLPSGFTYVGLGSRPSNFILGGTTGCIGMAGTPSAGQEGTYPLLIKILSYGKIGFIPASLPDTLYGYKIVILDATHVGIVDGREFSFGVKESYPNPASSVANIVVTNDEAALIDVRISDMIGRQVSASQHRINAGENTVQLNVATLPEGVYFYTITKGSQTITRKLIIER